MNYIDEKKKKNQQPVDGTTNDWLKYYTSQTQNVQNQLENREPFKFDVNADPLYEQMREQYVQQGKLASMDTMGQAATLTGGYGNSYAQSVGQQTYNRYMTQLNNAIPDLYSTAYDKYTQEGDDLYNKYSLYASARDSAKTELETEQNDMLTKIAGGYEPTKQQLEGVGLTAEDVNAYFSANKTYKSIEAGDAAYKAIKSEISEATTIGDLINLVNEWIALGYDPDVINGLTKAKANELKKGKLSEWDVDVLQGKKSNQGGSGGKYTY